MTRKNQKGRRAQSTRPADPDPHSQSPRRGTQSFQNNSRSSSKSQLIHQHKTSQLKPPQARPPQSNPPHPPSKPPSPSRPRQTSPIPSPKPTQQAAAHKPPQPHRKKKHRRNRKNKRPKPTPNYIPYFTHHEPYPPATMHPHCTSPHMRYRPCVECAWHWMLQDCIYEGQEMGLWDDTIVHGLDRAIFRMSR
ncbi:hypothetical protein EJ05DRAFT_501120 [Pseudovirgaria hyperparasitica]|uniref:Uncharacterized protein n=1 Tax=Pseudovirgaria hyperparasitica TaxID=470096 RepID=A0A6A6W5Z0_9PEZI|nr:uncharacterized protein EJ05DRAFT_501120 [Pseudovirgaria hyperparasitica]KAF2757589.1 hypothetical protein EJ05DRAFT_501120 [Pseudovirgaria hyperparasitica]